MRYVFFMRQKLLGSGFSSLTKTFCAKRASSSFIPPVRLFPPCTQKSKNLYLASQIRTAVTEIKSAEHYQKKMKCVDSSNLVVVQYTAHWCGPCRKVKPVVFKWSTEYPSVEFVTIDIDELTELAMEQDVKHVPTFIFMKGSEEVDRQIGGEKEKLQELIEKHK